MWCRTLALILLASEGRADSLIAQRTLPAATIIAAADAMVVDADIPDALTAAEDAIGLETRVAIYAGRPIRAQDLGPPTLVDRNALVTLVYRAGGLSILAEGRALARGGAGDAIRVMNLASRTTVSGFVQPDGTILVGGLR